MIRNAALVAILLAASYAAALTVAAADESAAPPVHAAQAPQGAEPGLEPEEDEFLSLLEAHIASGGPPKDGIPAVEKPQYTSVAEADEWLAPEDVVFGVDYESLVAAYPQRILVWHEIVNETVGGEKISVTYCPLTGTAIGFKGALTPGQVSNFGVSGKLVNSNLIMYDRATDSLWPQILARAISGSLRGARLEEFRVVWTTWGKWRQQHPNTKVLSRETGFIRNYGKNGDPYGSYLERDKGYYDSRQLYFRPIVDAGQLHPKTVVVGVRDDNGNAAAIVKDRLRRERSMELKLGDRTVVVAYDPALDFYSASFKGTAEWINAFDAMWFAWKAFYPDTQLLR